MNSINIQKIFNSIFRKNKRIDYGDGEYPPDNYTGLWEVYWPNGKLKFKSNYINGKEHGEYLCMWDNGKVAQEGHKENGISVGDWFDYWVSGQMFKRTVYKDNQNFDVIWYDETGKVTKLEVYVNGNKTR